MAAGQSLAVSSAFQLPPEVHDQKVRTKATVSSRNLRHQQCTSFRIVAFAGKFQEQVERSLCLREHHCCSQSVFQYTNSYLNVSSILSNFICWFAVDAYYNDCWKLGAQLHYCFNKLFVVSAPDAVEHKWVERCYKMKQDFACICVLDEYWRSICMTWCRGYHRALCRAGVRRVMMFGAEFRPICSVHVVISFLALSLTWDLISSSDVPVLSTSYRQKSCVASIHLTLTSCMSHLQGMPVISDSSWAE